MDMIAVLFVAAFWALIFVLVRALGSRNTWLRRSTIFIAIGFQIGDKLRRSGIARQFLHASWCVYRFRRYWRLYGATSNFLWRGYKDLAPTEHLPPAQCRGPRQEANSSLSDNINRHLWGLKTWERLFSILRFLRLFAAIPSFLLLRLRPLPPCLRGGVTSVTFY